MSAGWDGRPRRRPQVGLAGGVATRQQSLLRIAARLHGQDALGVRGSQRRGQTPRRSSLASRSRSSRSRSWRLAGSCHLIDRAVPTRWCEQILVARRSSLAIGRSTPPRCNSALHHQSSVEPPAVLVVVSEEGDVDRVPPVQLRLHRQGVTDAIALLTQLVQHEEASKCPKHCYATPALFLPRARAVCDCE